MNNKLNLKKISLIAIIFYIIIGVSLYFIGGEQFRYTKSKNSIMHDFSESLVGFIVKDVTVEQDFSVDSDEINKVSIKIATYARENHGDIFIKLINKENNTILFEQQVDTSILQDNSNFYLNTNKNIVGIRNKPLALVITSNIEDANEAISIYSGKANDNSFMCIDGKKTEKSLSFTVECTDKLWFGEYYWFILIGGFIILVAYLINLIVKQKNNKRSLGLNVITTFIRYRFLLSQLIERDFKTKYKRSVLGVLWSFLNPLLTMLVQYVVFSTIFKSDIPNFPVYLLSGIVVFNFFTEACGLGLMSIVGNASLITKVYVPKYIYPVSRVFSSVINLMLSLMPLFVVMLLTKTAITPTILLVPFPLICTLIFSIGITFMLSSAMVFFRDTQFLWNVMSLLWTYATPIFYPETIIPDKFVLILKFNPMYHFIRFLRACILQGVSPEPIAYLYCIVFSIGTFLVGTIIFKKTQDKFVLNI